MKLRLFFESARAKCRTAAQSTLATVVARDTRDSALGLLALSGFTAGTVELTGRWGWGAIVASTPLAVAYVLRRYAASRGAR